MEKDDVGESRELPEVFNRICLRLFLEDLEEIMQNAAQRDEKYRRKTYKCVEQHEKFHRGQSKFEKELEEKGRGHFKGKASYNFPELLEGRQFQTLALRESQG